eukprot:667892_1
MGNSSCIRSLSTCIRSSSRNNMHTKLVNVQRCSNEPSYTIENREPPNNSNNIQSCCSAFTVRIKRMRAYLPKMKVKQQHEKPDTEDMKHGDDDLSCQCIKSCLYYWLWFWSYIDCKSCSIHTFTIAVVLVVVSITNVWCALLQNADWSDHLICTFWIILAIATYRYLRCNLTLTQSDIEQGFTDHRSEAVIYVVIFSLLFTVIPFVIFFPGICPSSNSYDHILGSCTEYVVNASTIYTLNIVVLIECLLVKQRLIALGEASKADTCREVLDALVDIESSIQELRRKWAGIVTLSFIYHLAHPTNALVTWMITEFEDNHYWTYCYFDSTAQVVLVNCGSAIRIIALFYPIIRLNMAYDSLCPVFHTHLVRKKEYDAEVKKNIMERFEDKYVVDVSVKFTLLCGVNVDWKTFGGGIGVLVAQMISVWATTYSQPK